MKERKGIQQQQKKQTLNLPKTGWSRLQEQVAALGEQLANRLISGVVSKTL